MDVLKRANQFSLLKCGKFERMVCNSYSTAPPKMADATCGACAKITICGLKSRNQTSFKKIFRPVQLL